MAEMILLRNELNAIGNNYNQVVKRLHTLEHLGEVKAWLLLNESTNKILIGKVSESNLKLLKSMTNGCDNKERRIFKKCALL